MALFSKTKYFHSIFFVLFILSNLTLMAQNTPDPQTATTEETEILLDAGTAGLPEGTEAKSPSSVWILIRIVLVLGIVCAGIYGVVYLLKKTTRINAGNDPYLKNVASLPLSPSKAIQVITLGSQAFLIGVTDQSISLISEIVDRELIDTMNLAADRTNPVPKETFAAVLSALLPKKTSGSGAHDNPTRGSPKDSEAALATADFLRSQRERLQRSSLSGMTDEGRDAP